MFRVRTEDAMQAFLLAWGFAVLGLLLNIWLLQLIAVLLFVTAFRSYDPALDEDPPDTKWIRIRD